MSDIVMSIKLLHIGIYGIMLVTNAETRLARFGDMTLRLNECPMNECIE